LKKNKHDEKPQQSVNFFFARFHSICCGLDDGKTSKLRLKSLVSLKATYASFCSVRAQGTVIVKRLEDLAKEGDSPVDSFPWFDPSQ